MRTKCTKILTLLMVFISAISFAQVQVSGIVKDDAGEPLPGTYIESESGESVETDVNGKYTITANEGEELTFSFIGMEDKVQTVSGSSMNITLGEGEGNKIEEVVVQAAGIKREKKTVGAATTTVGSEVLEKSTPVDLGAALKGKVAGATISTTSTDPGASTSFVLRGTSSLSSNQALIVVDGVPLTNATRTDTSINGATDFGGGISDIPVESIESVTVLKGASSTALYGSLGANGVIVITTKKGKKGRVDVNVNSRTMFTSVLRTPKYQNKFGQGWDGQHILDENGSWGAALDGKDRVWGRVVDNSQQVAPYSFNENALKDFFETGTLYSNNIAISGSGGENSKFRLTYGNVTQDGIYPTNTDSYERNNIGVSGEVKKGNLTISGAINYVTTEGSAVAAGQGLSVYNNLLQIPNNFDIRNFKDLSNPFNSVGNYYTPYGVTNPYYALTEFGNKNSRDRTYGSIELKYDLNDWSSLVYRVGGDFVNNRGRTWQPIVDAAPGTPNDGSSTEDDGYYGERYQRDTKLNHDFLYNFERDLSDTFSLEGNVGFNIYNVTTEFFNSEVNSINQNGFYSFSNGKTSPVNTSQRSKQNKYGVYGAFTLGYKDAIYLNANIRNDFDSSLPSDTRKILYGGVNTSVLLTNLIPSLKSDFVNYIKIRGGYGETGTGAELLSYYASQGGNALGVNTANGNQGFRDIVYPNNGISAFTIQNRSANPNLDIERTKEFEVGAEMQLLKNRVKIDATYYDKLTEGVIDLLPLAPSTGYTSQYANIADIRNKGVEVMLDLTWIKKKQRDGLNWNTVFNFATNDSNVEDLVDGLDRITLTGVGTNSLFIEKGSPVGLLEGLAPLTSPDGNIVVDSNGIPIAGSSPVTYGDTQYDYTLGITNNLSYKGFGLNFTLDTRQGGLMYSRTANITAFTGNSIKTTYNNRQPFIVPNSVVDNGDGTYSENTTAVSTDRMDDYYRANALERNDVIDKSFVKLREVVLSYSMPSSVLESTFIKNLKFSLIGNNLLLWTPSDNQFVDPESTTFGNDINGQFGEYGSNPSTRSYGFSINARF